MGLKHSTRVVDNIDKINRLESRYVESSGEIESLKSRKKEINEKLRNARIEYDSIKGMNLGKSERALKKADKRTTIDGLEKILERTREEIYRLERDKDKAFERRERIKGKTVRKMSFEGSGAVGGSVNRGTGLNSVLAKNKVGDVAAVAKMLEMMRAGSSPAGSKVGSPVNAITRHVDSNTKLKGIIVDKDRVVEKTVIDTGKKRAATIKMR